jgi:hypothetical protein
MASNAEARLTADSPSGDWRIQQAADGRIVEFVDAQWSKDDSDLPSGSIGTDVTVLIEGELITQRIVWTSAQLEAAFRDGEGTSS